MSQYKSTKSGATTYGSVRGASRRVSVHGQRGAAAATLACVTPGADPVSWVLPVCARATGGRCRAAPTEPGAAPVGRGRHRRGAGHGRVSAGRCAGRVQKTPCMDPVLLAHPDRPCALSCRCRTLATRVLPGRAMRASAGATRGPVADGRRALAAWGQKMPTMDPEPLVQPDRARAHGGRCRVPATSRVHRTPAAGRSRVAAAACVTAAAVAHARTVSNPGLFVPTVNRGVEV